MGMRSAVVMDGKSNMQQLSLVHDSGNCCSTALQLPCVFFLATGCKRNP
jgi:hypothetical protein